MRGRCYPTDLAPFAPRGDSDNRAHAPARSVRFRRSEACQHVLRDLALPNLERLLALLTPAGRDEGDAGSFSPPHERALAAAWGWHGGDGTLPFAAHAAAADGIATGELAWALLTPTHWQLGRDDVTLLDPDLLGLAEPESRALFASAARAVRERRLRRRLGRQRPLVCGARRPAGAGDGVARPRHRPQRRSLAARRRRHAGEKRAVARLVRRLQSEAQLVFHSHAVNEAREERGELAVNSFWLSGCGRRQAADPAATPELATALRSPLLGADWAAWAEAWRALDAGALARAARAGAARRRR